MKKRLQSIAIVAALMALTVILGLVACNSDPEQAARASLTEELEGLKNPDSPVFQQAVSPLGDLGQLGID